MRLPWCASLTVATAITVVPILGCGGPPPPTALPISLVAGVYGGGVYESHNGGLSWSELDGASAPPPAFVKRLAWGPAGSLFVATSGAGIYRRSEEGFHPVEGDGPEVVSAIAATGPGHDTIWAATPEHGVYVSRDGGRSWERQNAGLDFQHVTGLAVSSDGGTLYCATDGGLFRIRDEGPESRWSWITEPIGPWEARAVGCGVGSHPLIVAGGAGVDGPPPTLLGHDAEGSWRDGGRDLPDGNVFDVELVEEADRSSIFLATSEGVFTSEDQGDSWRRFGRYGPERIVLALAQARGQLFAGGEEGLFRIPLEGGSWSRVNRGLPRTAVTSILPGP